MKKALILLFALLPGYVLSQKTGDTARPAPVNAGKARTMDGHGNFIKLNVARLLLIDFSVSYERKISQKISVELECAYQAPLESHNHSDAGNPFFGVITALPLPGRGYSLEAGPKIYRLNRNHPGFYIQPWVIFKNMKCTDVSFRSAVYEDKDKRYPYGDNRYQAYGAVLRVGSMKDLGLVVLDFYAGVGVRVMNNHYDLYGYWDGEDEKMATYNKDGSPVSFSKVTALPALNLGLKIGFGFGR